MKVLVITHEFTISGASLMLFRVAKFLMWRGMQIDVMSLLPTDGPLADMYRDAGARVVEKIKPRDYRFGVANTIFSGGAVANLGTKIPMVWWIHEGDNGLGVVLSDPVNYQRAFGSAARIVFPARHLKDCIYKSFIHHLPEETLVVLPNGIDLPQDIVPAKKGKGVVRIVSVATVDQRKRAGDLLEALERLNMKNLEAIFVGRKYWLSDGGLAVLERERQHRRERFRFLGELPNEQAMSWLASADIFAHPAGVEAHPLAPIEAGLFGKPIILADIAVYEGLWRHGRNCLLHPVGDIDLLAMQLAGLCSNPGLAQRLGEQARLTAGRFSNNAFLKHFEDAVLTGLI
ncbi:MAG: glycosyltransferase [Rhodocyclaceae bacterium]|nr:glycosyltransferase [Rhodocyclaceae bacterium]